MQKTIARWALTLAAIFVVGPIAGLAVRRVEAPDGGQALVMLGSASGVMAVFVTLLLGSAMGLAAARLIHVRHGLFCAGLVFAWAGWGAGDLLGWVQRFRGEAGFMALLPDALVLSVAGAALAWAIAMFARREPTPEASAPPRDPEPILSIGTLSAVVVGAIAAFLAASIVSQSPASGQAFAAAALAGLAAGVVAKALNYFVQPQAYVWGVLVVGAVTPIACAATTQSIADDTLGRDLIAIAWVTPWMWLAGAFVGTPFGIAWAESMVRQTSHAQPLARKPASGGPRIKRAAD